MCVNNYRDNFELGQADRAYVKLGHNILKYETDDNVGDTWQSVDQSIQQSINHHLKTGEWVMSCYRGAHRRLIWVVVIGSSTEEYLFHFAEMQGVLVVRPELHETHIARLGQLRDTLYARKESTEQMENHFSLKKRNVYVILWEL